MLFSERRLFVVIKRIANAREDFRFANIRISKSAMKFLCLMRKGEKRDSVARVCFERNIDPSTFVHANVAKEKANVAKRVVTSFALILR